MYISRTEARCVYSTLSRRPKNTLRGYTTSSYSTPAPVGSSAAEVQSAREYCSSLLQKYDTPSHTLLAFIPPPAQPAYLALRAFNLEIARIPDTTSTPPVSALRYQFWRDNITRTLAGTPPAHPVSVLLAHALADLDARTQGSARLSKHWFLRFIAAREAHGDGRPHPTLEALEKYAEDTYSTLLYLTLQALPMTSVTADHVASHVGKAMGIVAVLRGLPLVAFPAPPNHHSNSRSLGGSLEGQRGRQQGRVTLPLDVMARTGVRDEDVLRLGGAAEGLRDAVFEVATRASDHLITARQMLRNVSAGKDVGHAYEYEGEEGHEYGGGGGERPRNDAGGHGRATRQREEIHRAFGVMMPAVATALWLDKLQKYDFDIFRDQLRRRDWQLPWKAYFAHRRKMF